MMDLLLFSFCVLAMGIIALPALIALAADPSIPRPNKPRKKRPF